MLVGFLSIKNMGVDINFRALAAMQAEILKKDANTPKSRPPSLKMTSVVNETPSGFLNDFFQIALDHVYFLKTQTTISIVTFSLGITLVIMIITKNVILSYFFGIFLPFRCKMTALICIDPVFFPIIMFIGLPCIIDMGIDTDIRNLDALQAQILKNDLNAPRTRRPSWKMAAVEKVRQIQAKHPK